MDAQPPREYIAHSYLIKLLRLVREGRLCLAPGSVTHIAVRHDENCPLLIPGASPATCACDPDVEIGFAQPGTPS